MKPNKMKLIGITGGVGAGKSLVLQLLQKHCRCRVLLADEVGNEVKLPGQPCYERLVELLGKQVLSSDGTIDRKKMAERIFADPALLDQVNGIIHPEVETLYFKAGGGGAEQRRDRLLLPGGGASHRMRL